MDARLLVFVAAGLALTPPVHAETRPSREGEAPLSRAPLLASRALLPGLDLRGLDRLFDAAGPHPALEPARRYGPPAPEWTPAHTPPSRLNPAYPPPRRRYFRLKTMRHPLVVPNPTASREYRRTFRILLSQPGKTDQYDDLILKYAREHRLDPRLMKAIMAAESQFTRDALSPAGAVGLMQVMPATAEGVGVPRRLLTDPEANIRAGAAYLAYLFHTAWDRFKLKGVRFQDAPLWVVQRVIAAYNAGPLFLFRDRWYRETRTYVRKVLLFYQSKVTDIRRLPKTRQDVPDFRLTRSSAGFYN